MEIPDSPRKIAQGVALGIALDFLPLPLISIPVSFILAKLFRINAVSAVLAVIFFKWAVPVFFYFDFLVGKLLIGETAQGKDVLEGVSFTGPDAWIAWIKGLGYPFLLGSVVNSIIVGVIVYFAVKALLDYYRRKKNSRFISLPQPEKAR
jgi:uncharacterized protein (DUF2062 family)